MILGRGEIVRPARGFPSCGVVLANPGVPLATASVYAALNAPPSAASGESAEPPDFRGDFAALAAYMLARGNDLEGTAARLAPPINEVLAALSGLPGVRVARLSGSGPTCFGLFASEDQARRAAAALAGQHPNWWVIATRLGAPIPDRHQQSLVMAGLVPAIHGFANCTAEIRGCPALRPGMTKL